MSPEVVFFHYHSLIHYPSELDLLLLKLYRGLNQSLESYLPFAATVLCVIEIWQASSKAYTEQFFKSRFLLIFENTALSLIANKLFSTVDIGQILIRICLFGAVKVVHILTLP